MANKHLLETKLSSIAHYNSEIKKYSEAIKVTQSTIADIVKSCEEYFPFQDGDILLRDTRLYRVKLDKPVEPYLSGDSIGFRVWLQQPIRSSYEQKWESYSDSMTNIPLDTLPKYKVIGNTNANSNG